MEYLIAIGTVSLIHLLAVVSPGPDFIVAVKNSIAYSRRTGLWTSVGFGLGISVHILYSFAGIAYVVSQSILLFNLIKILGALYLVYIGFKAFTGNTKDVAITSEREKGSLSPCQAIKIGFLTNVLNPKATLFFLSLFTLVISPETPLSVQGIMGSVMVINTILWFSLVALFFSQEKVVKQYNKYQNIFNKVLGSLLIGLGVKIAFIQK